MQPSVILVACGLASGRTCEVVQWRGGPVEIEQGSGWDCPCGDTATPSPCSKGGTWWCRSWAPGGTTSCPSPHWPLAGDSLTVNMCGWAPTIDWRTEASGFTWALGPGGRGGTDAGRELPAPLPSLLWWLCGWLHRQGLGWGDNQQKGNEGTGEMREQGCGPSLSAPSPSRAVRHGSEGLQALEHCVARWGPLAAPLCFPAFTHQEA